MRSAQCTLLDTCDPFLFQHAVQKHLKTLFVRATHKKGTQGAHCLFAGRHRLVAAARLDESNLRPVLQTIRLARIKLDAMRRGTKGSQGTHMKNEGGSWHAVKGKDQDRLEGLGGHCAS
jgi:hypothetical protein